MSSSGSTSDLALTNRRDAMAEAVNGTVAEGKLALDFYDRNRVAAWVRGADAVDVKIIERFAKAFGMVARLLASG